MIAAIHQPNFFPWLGYFKKMVSVDTFVFLDSVPFPKSGRGSWMNRVKILINGTSKWITCPIQRKHGIQIIKDIIIDDNQLWRNKMLLTLETNYKKAPFFSEIMPIIKEMIFYNESFLTEYNIKNISCFVSLLGIKVKFVSQSELNVRDIFENTGSKRLVSICKELGADVYLSGDGSVEYEDLSIYEQDSISYEKLGFVHPVYCQFNTKEFISGLSILDVLFNIGIDGTRKLLGIGHI